mmetsp:Transcript_8815/g.12136  ORF Transcript_8815/g.12136 Transcript_8815/m.12136 type:complete len:82 (-) Transcript_8815:1598-1843(-)
MSASRDSSIRFWDYRGSKNDKDKMFYCDFESKRKISSASTSSDGLLVCAAEEEGGILHLWKIDYSNSTSIPIMKVVLSVNP